MDYGMSSMGVWSSLGRREGVFHAGGLWRVKDLFLTVLWAWEGILTDAGDDRMRQYVGGSSIFRAVE